MEKRTRPAEAPAPVNGDAESPGPGAPEAGQSLARDDLPEAERIEQQNDLA